jgi:hypothetical protein
LEQLAKGAIRDVGLDWEAGHVPTGVSENKKDNKDGGNDENVGTAKLHLVSANIFLKDQDFVKKGHELDAPPPIIFIVR